MDDNIREALGAIFFPAKNQAIDSRAGLTVLECFWRLADSGRPRVRASTSSWSFGAPRIIL